MAAYLSEWLELLLRWFHVVAGMAWIGESFYFVMQDRSLQPSQDPRAIAAGVAGEIWSVHGGGFYHAQKYAAAPDRLPENLHWSKWKSYATWLSGFLLFTVLYLAQPGTYLIDPAVAQLSSPEADLAAVLFLLVGWLVYDRLCRILLKSEAELGAAMLVFISAAAFVATHLFSGRAAFLITGAMLATIMSANVFLVIIPGQHRMVARLASGTVPDPQDGVRGKQRSTHNTYFTLPVVFAMISNHYAMTYSFPGSWLVLMLIMAAGALTRQFFVLWHSGTHVWALPVAGAALITAIIAWLAPPAATASAGTDIHVADIQPIIAERCMPCHAKRPHLMAAAPAGLVLETPQEILANAGRIYTQAVQLKAMPLGNLTHITPNERSRIADWFANGAKP